jgi:hypothetical protein
VNREVQRYISQNQLILSLFKNQKHKTRREVDPCDFDLFFKTSRNLILFLIDFVTQNHFITYRKKFGKIVKDENIWQRFS